tara:strand:- start:23 stop:397 length:375 start_codon:yes stop_codon:yes gene_type:complete
MDWYEDEFYPLVERAIEESFEGRFLFNCYLYLKANKATKPQIRKFCASSTAEELSQTSLELEMYIKGGDTTLREAYGHIPKPQARKIRNYLYGILEDAWKYELERKPGRKPKPKTKARRKVATK